MSMDYMAAFDISASGMSVQKIRLDTVALNLANVNTTSSADGGAYKRLQVIIGERSESQFAQMFSSISSRAHFAGAEVINVVPSEEPPRLVYEPGHPHADEKGFVAYPSVDPVSEMVSLMEATRAYEANVKALNAAKVMALQALEIGG